MTQWLSDADIDAFKALATGGPIGADFVLLAMSRGDALKATCADLREARAALWELIGAICDYMSDIDKSDEFMLDAIRTARARMENK